MNLNKKGYTLIELLAVILIIGLILVLSTYGIIKAVKSSKEKVTTLSEKSIKEAAETYATEKNDDSNYWLDITDKENKYFCITFSFSLLSQHSDIFFMISTRWLAIS